jgi:hypothetical protein
MKTMIKEIWANAKRIWDHLDTYGSCSFEKLKEQLNMNDNEICAALGWLERENNVIISKKNGGEYISLVY